MEGPIRLGTTALLGVLFVAGVAGITCQQRRALREAAWPQPADSGWQLRLADGSVPERLIPGDRPGLPLADGDELSFLEEDGAYHQIETLVAGLYLEGDAGCELGLRGGAARLRVLPGGDRVRLVVHDDEASAIETALPSPAAGQPLVLKVLLKGPTLYVTMDGQRLLEAPALVGPLGVMAVRAQGGTARVVRFQCTGNETNEPGGWQRFTLQVGWQPPADESVAASDRRVALLGLAGLLLAASFLRALCARRPPLGALGRGALLLGVAAVAGALPALVASLLPGLAETLDPRWWDTRALLVPGVLLLLAALPLALRGLAPHLRAPAPDGRGRVLDAARALALAALAAGATGWVCTQDALEQILPRRALEFEAAKRAAPDGFTLPGSVHLDLASAVEVPGLWRDGELSARVTLEPGAILGVRVRAPDPHLARGLELLLSTDPRLPCGWRHEDNLVFDALDSGGGVVPAGQPLQLRIAMRGRELAAFVDGQPLATASDEFYAVGAIVLLVQRGAGELEQLAVQPQDSEPVPEPSPRHELAAVLPAAATPAIALLLFTLLAAALLRQPWPSLLEPAAFACGPFLLAQWGWRSDGLLPEGTLRWSALASIGVLFLVVGLRAEAGRRGRACLLLLAALAGVPAALHVGLSDDAVISDVREYKAHYAVWTGERQEEDLLYLTHPRMRLFNEWLAEHRLRTGTHTLEKPAGVQRVLVLGASCTWGYRLPPDRHLEWPAIVGSQLGPDVELLNGGFIGAPSYVLRRSFRDVLLAFHPDVLVLSLYYADAFALAQADEPGYYAAITAPGFERSWLFDAGVLANLAPSRARFERVRHELREGVARSGMEWDAAQGEAAPPARFAAELREYARLCAEHDMRLVLVLEPLSGDVPAPFKDEFVEAMQQVAAESHSPFVDPRPALAAAGGERLFFDPVHPNAAGHIILAREVLPAVQEALSQR